MHWSLLLQRPVCLSLFLLLLFRTSLADPVNVTIDDQNGDPTNGLHILYNPPGAWQVGQTCTDCTARPSPASDAHLGTWMDASFFPTGTSSSLSGQIIQASVSFVGTAVYVVCILTGSSTSPDGNTDLTFKIDNTTTSTFQKAPDGNATYLFNQTVFAQTGLPNRLHTITIESGHAGKKALVLLDSIIYTTDDNSTTSSSATSSSSTSSSSDASQSGSSTNVGAIVGVVVAVAAVVLGVSIALYVFSRRRQRKRSVRISIDGDATVEVYAPRRYSGSGSRSRGLDMRNSVHYVGSEVPLSEYTVSQSVTSYGYPTTRTASGSDWGSEARMSGLGASSEALSPSTWTDFTRNVAPSEVESTVFNDEVSPPSYDAVAYSGAASRPSDIHSPSDNIRSQHYHPDQKL